MKKPSGTSHSALLCTEKDEGTFESLVLYRQLTWSLPAVAGTALVHRRSDALVLGHLPAALLLLWLVSLARPAGSLGGRARAGGGGQRGTRRRHGTAA